MSCPNGDIFCRECVLSNLVGQKKGIKRAKKAAEQAARQALQAKALQDAEIQGRTVRDFERLQSGLEAKPGARMSGLGKTAQAPDSQPAAKAGSKRKFDLDDVDLSQAVQADRQRAKSELENEKVRLYQPNPPFQASMKLRPLSIARRQSVPRTPWPHSGRPRSPQRLEPLDPAAQPKRCRPLVQHRWSRSLIHIRSRRLSR